MIIDETNKPFIDKLQELKDANDFKHILILGGVGVGKTYITKEIFDKAYFINEGTFKQHLSSGILKLCHPEDRASRNQYPLDCLAKKSLVIYDDLGTAEVTEAYIDKMLYRLDERLASDNKQTIFTSNLSLEDIEKREKRIGSRVLMNAKVLVLSGKDRRKQGVEVFKY